MDRKDFITKSILASAVGAVAPHLLIAANVKQAESTYDKLIKKVGFNHLPNKEYKTMNTVIHKAETRGSANHGWLNSNHTLSFANYHNPEKNQFRSTSSLK